MLMLRCLIQAPAPAGRPPVTNGPRNLNLTGHVGFDSLPDQLVNKSVAQGFCFNILCLGKAAAACLNALQINCFICSFVTHI